MAAKWLETNCLCLFIELWKLWCFTTWYACDYIWTECRANPLRSSHPERGWILAFPAHGFCTPWKAASRYLQEGMKSKDLTFSGTEVPPAKGRLVWNVPYPVTTKGLMGLGSLHESSRWAKTCESLALLSWKLGGASHQHQWEQDQDKRQHVWGCWKQQIKELVRTSAKQYAISLIRKKLLHSLACALPSIHISMLFAMDLLCSALVCGVMGSSLIQLKSKNGILKKRENEIKRLAAVTCSLCKSNSLFISKTCWDLFLFNPSDFYWRASMPFTREKVSFTVSGSLHFYQYSLGIITTEQILGVTVSDGQEIFHFCTFHQYVLFPKCLYNFFSLSNLFAHGPWFSLHFTIGFKQHVPWL